MFKFNNLRIQRHQDEDTYYPYFFIVEFKQINADWAYFNLYLNFVSLRIQSECEKMRTRITPNTNTFHTLLLLSYFTSFT